MTRSAILVVGCLLLAGLAGLATAHGAVSLGFDAETVPIETGGQTQVTVVVDQADDGIGSYELTVSAGNGTVGIEDVRVAGNPSALDTTYSQNGTSVTVSASGLDLTGPTVRVFTLALDGRSPGSETLAITSASVVPPTGAPYLTAQRGTAELVVTEQGARSDGPSGYPLALLAGVAVVVLLATAFVYVRIRTMLQS